MISVIMSTYREPLQYIRLSLGSVLNQTLKDLDIVLIVDDPSNLNLIRLLEEFAKKDKRIQLHINDNNLGLTGSLNKALAYSKGEYIARMDADDISDETRLEKQLEWLNNNNLDMVGSNIHNIDEDGIIISGTSIFPEKNNLIIKEAKYNSPLAHPTWLGKKEVFRQLNGYQEIDACEDYDFLVRAILAGFKLGNIQEPLLKYRINSSGISSTKKAKQKAALFFIRNNYRHGRVTTESEYNQFIESSAGKKKIADLEEYYKKTTRLKNMSGNKIKKALYAATIFASSTEARALLANIIKEKIEVK